MKNIIIAVLGFFSLLSIRGFSQEKKEIHYLADTLTTSKGNRILEIGQEGKLRYYMFYCPCVPPYGQGYNLSFRVYKSNGAPEKKIPEFAFMSWGELSALATSNNAVFNKKFRFFMTELLPDKTYLTSEVLLVHYREAVRDFITLPRP